MKNIISLLLSLILLLLISASCNTTEPPSNTTLTIKLEDVSCTEAWITLKTTNLQLPAAITLKQTNQTGDTKTQILNLNTQDSLLYIDSLLPNQTYKILAAMQQPSNASNELSITTIDTTSHNFTFETFTFGGTAGSSTFYDVAIINENNIWAVGEIYVADTSINGYTKYNAVHWDGNNWELKRINMQSSCNPITYPPLKAIWAFSANNIAVTSGGSIGWFDGNTNRTDCGIRSILTGSINKLWGSSSSDLYAVGNNGNIAHYNGQSWKKIESGTDTDFKDIYGTTDGKELWACGWANRNGRVAIIKIKESGEVESVWDSQTNRTFSYYYHGQLLNTLWANGNGEFIFATGIVTRHSLLNNRFLRFDWVPYLNGWKVLDLGNYSYRIRGSNKNNISIAGDEAMIWHYNGRTWHKFEELQYFDDRLYGLTITENLIIAVGKRYSGLTSGALLLVGRR